MLLRFSSGNNKDVKLHLRSNVPVRYILSQKEVEQATLNLNMTSLKQQLLQIAHQEKQNMCNLAVDNEYENDIKYWENTFSANGYIIDNSISSFTEKNNIIHTNIQMAVDDIFN